MSNPAILIGSVLFRSDYGYKLVCSLKMKTSVFRMHKERHGLCWRRWESWQKTREIELGIDKGSLWTRLPCLNGFTTTARLTGQWWSFGGRYLGILEADRNINVKNNSIVVIEKKRGLWKMKYQYYALRLFPYALQDMLPMDSTSTDIVTSVHLHSKLAYKNRYMLYVIHRNA